MPSTSPKTPSYPHTPFSSGIFTCRALHTSRRSRESRVSKHVIFLAARTRWPSYEDVGRAFTPTMAAPITKSRRLPLRHWKLLANWQQHRRFTLSLKQSDCHRRGLSHSPSCIQFSLWHWPFLWFPSLMARRLHALLVLCSLMVFKLWP